MASATTNASAFGCSGIFGILATFLLAVACYSLWLWSDGMDDPRAILNLAFVVVVKAYGWFCGICAVAFLGVLGLSVVSRR